MTDMLLSDFFQIIDSQYDIEQALNKTKMAKSNSSKRSKITEQALDEVEFESIKNTVLKLLLRVNKIQQSK